MKKLFFLFAFLSAYLIVNGGEPVEGAEVFVEQSGNENPISIGKTGINGKLMVGHGQLKSGNINFFIRIPQEFYSTKILGKTSSTRVRFFLK